MTTWAKQGGLLIGPGLVENLFGDPDSLKVGWGPKLVVAFVEGIPEDVRAKAIKSLLCFNFLKWISPSADCKNCGVSRSIIWRWRFQRLFYSSHHLISFPHKLEQLICHLSYIQTWNLLRESRAWLM